MVLLMVTAINLLELFDLVAEAEHAIQTLGSVSSHHSAVGLGERERSRHCEEQ